MARIVVVGKPFEKILIQDLEKKQTLREHTINPPGQERYIRPVDGDAVGAALGELATLAGGDLKADGLKEFLEATVSQADPADIDVSESAIETAATAAIDGGNVDPTDEKQEKILLEIQDLLSYRFVETGHFLLSLHNGVLSKMVEREDGEGNPDPWIVVLTDEGDAPFEL